MSAAATGPGPNRYALMALWKSRPTTAVLMPSYSSQLCPPIVSVGLGSANGTFINGKRVAKETANGGDELRFDTVRFMLVAPGQEIQSSQHKTPQAPAATADSQGGGLLRSVGWVLLGIGLAALLIAGLSYLGFVKI